MEQIDQTVLEDDISDEEECQLIVEGPLDHGSKSIRQVDYTILFQMLAIIVAYNIDLRKY